MREVTRKDIAGCTGKLCWFDVHRYGASPLKSSYADALNHDVEERNFTAFHEEWRLSCMCSAGNAQIEVLWMKISTGINDTRIAIDSSVENISWSKSYTAFISDGGLRPPCVPQHLLHNRTSCTDKLQLYWRKSFHFANFQFSDKYVIWVRRCLRCIAEQCFSAEMQKLSLTNPLKRVTKICRNIRSSDKFHIY